MSELEIRREGSRYIGQLDGKDVAFVDAENVAEDAIAIRHTEVDPGYEGRGLAGTIVKHVIEDARLHQRKVIPMCGYAAAYIERHPEYKKDVR
jgi:uncharacterized protein